jgi:AraC-like DNA-binding protein
MDGNGAGDASGLVTARLETDQVSETVLLHRPLWLEGATFWTVTHSVRHWSMHHDTFTASLVTGETSAMRAKWHSRGEERAVGPGSVQLMNPGETHRTTAVSGPASFFVLWWTPEAMQQAAREAGAVGGVHFTRPQLDGSPVSQALGRLHDSIQLGAERLQVEHCYLEGLASLLKHACDAGGAIPRPRRGHPRLRRALELMHDLFAQSISLDDLAREAELSKFHLARCFRENTGLAPHQYQKLLRLQAARRLIEQGVTVQDAALRSGFADSPHLARTFRTWLGVSPSQWSRATQLASP